MISKQTLFDRILVIDDDPTSTFLIALTLEEENLAGHVQTYHSAEAALAFINACFAHESACPDLILLDLNMPAMSGFEFMDALKGSGKSRLIHERIVVLTSSTSTKDREKAGTYAVRDYLEKPLAPQALKALAR